MKSSVTDNSGPSNAFNFIVSDSAVEYRKQARKSMHLQVNPVADDFNRNQRGSGGGVDNFGADTQKPAENAGGNSIFQEILGQDDDDGDNIIRPPKDTILDGLGRNGSIINSSVLNQPVSIPKFVFDAPADWLDESSDDDCNLPGGFSIGNL